MDAINVYGYRFITFELDYVYDAGTAVTMTCSESDASGGTYRPIQALVMSSFTATSDTLTWSQAIAAANESWVWTVALHGYKFIKCTWTVTGATASDTLTVGAVVGD